MSSSRCDDAIARANQNGRALLKFIAPNEVGLTKSHQRGYYIPKSVSSAFTPFPPTKGINNDHDAEVFWHDGRVTHSIVKWYGTDSRSEYRLTRFNRERNFPHLSPDRVGSLLVLVPDKSDSHCIYAYILESEDDIAEVQAALGIEILTTWGFFNSSVEEDSSASQDACVRRRFEEFVQDVDAFPPTAVLAREARDALLRCIPKFHDLSVDDQLLRFIDAEYRLFSLF